MAISDVLLVALAREAVIVTAAARQSPVHVSVEVSGMGPARARVAARRQVAAGATSLTSIGFAGALRTPLRFGDVLLPHEVVDSSGQRFAADARMHAQLSDALHPQLSFCQGALTSVDYVVGDRVQKHALGRRLDVDAVDMESAAIAAVARDAGVPFAALRVVCDGPLQHIPQCTEGAVDVFGRVNVARLMSGLALRPWELGALLRLGRSTAYAARILEHVMRTVLVEARN